jgi:hypothetical protein
MIKSFFQLSPNAKTFLPGLPSAVKPPTQTTTIQTASEADQQLPILAASKPALSTTTNLKRTSMSEQLSTTQSTPTAITTETENLTMPTTSAPTASSNKDTFNKPTQHSTESAQVQVTTHSLYTNTSTTIEAMIIQKTPF